MKLMDDYLYKNNYHNYEFFSLNIFKSEKRFAYAMVFYGPATYIETDSRSAVIYNVFARVKYETWPATRWSFKLLIHCCLCTPFAVLFHFFLFFFSNFPPKHSACFSKCLNLLCFGFIFTCFLKPIINIERRDDQISALTLFFLDQNLFSSFWVFVLSLVGQMFWMNFTQKREKKSQQKFETRPTTKNSFSILTHTHTPRHKWKWAVMLA